VSGPEECHAGVPLADDFSEIVENVITAAVQRDAIATARDFPAGSIDDLIIPLCEENPMPCRRRDSTVVEKARLKCERVPNA